VARLNQVLLSTCMPSSLRPRRPGLCKTDWQY
jgi:hypothetical protein